MSVVIRHPFRHSATHGPPNLPIGIPHLVSNRLGQRGQRPCQRFMGHPYVSALRNESASSSEEETLSEDAAAPVAKMQQVQENHATRTKSLRLSDHPPDSMIPGAKARSRPETSHTLTSTIPLPSGQIPPSNAGPETFKQSWVAPLDSITPESSTPDVAPASDEAEHTQSQGTSLDASIQALEAAGKGQSQQSWSNPLDAMNISKYTMKVALEWAEAGSSFFENAVAGGRIIQIKGVVDSSIYDNGFSSLQQFMDPPALDVMDRELVLSVLESQLSWVITLESQLSWAVTLSPLIIHPRISNSELPPFQTCPAPKLWLRR